MSQKTRGQVCGARLLLGEPSSSTAVSPSGRPPLHQRRRLDEKHPRPDAAAINSGLQPWFRTPVVRAARLRRLSSGFARSRWTSSSPPQPFPATAILGHPVPGACGVLLAGSGGYLRVSRNCPALSAASRESYAVQSPVQQPSTTSPRTVSQISQHQRELSEMGRTSTVNRSPHSVSMRLAS